MVFLRKMKKGDNIYVYRVETYREKGTNKVKQNSEYLGKEILKNGETIILPPKYKRGGVRKVLSFGGPVGLYQLAVDFNLDLIVNDAVEGCTGIKDVGRKIVVLAINKVLSNDGFEGIGRWFCSTSLSKYSDLVSGDFSPKKVRGLYALLSLENPDIIAMIEDGIIRQIKKMFPGDLSVLIYDLTDLLFYGSVNGLAKYGHAYRRNGYEKQINLVLAVTRESKLPVHHRVLPGNIVSVSTIRRFAHELKGFDLKNSIAVIDRGFYSNRNLDEISSAECDVIGALPSTVNIREDVLDKCTGIEHPRYYMNYNDEILFVMEKKIDDKRFVVIHSPVKYGKDLEKFYASINEREGYLKQYMNVDFPDKEDMLDEIDCVCKPYQKCFEITEKKTKKGWRFSYGLLNKEVQKKTRRLGKTVLFTTTSFSMYDVIKTYREKDVVEKTFCIMKKRGLLPINATTEETTKVKGMFAVFGYLLLSLLRTKLEDKKKKSDKAFSLDKKLRLLDEIKQVVFNNDSTTFTDLLNEQKEMLEKLNVVIK